MDREAHGWGVRDIDGGWDGVGYEFRKMWIVGDIWMGAGDMAFFEQGGWEERIRYKKGDVLYSLPTMIHQKSLHHNTKL